MSNNRRDGSKLSFSERDKVMRERKQGRGPGGARREHEPSGFAQKSYRAALERAFDSGQLAEFAATLQRNNGSFDAAFRAAGKAVPAVDEAPGPGGSAAVAVRGAGAAAPAAPAEGVEAGAAVDAAASTAARLGADNPERSERRSLAKKILEAEAPRDVAKAVDRYMERFERLPADYEVLEKALVHARARVVLHALEQLESLVGARKPRRSRSLGVQLSILEDTHGDDEVRAVAARIRAALE